MRLSPRTREAATAPATTSKSKSKSNPPRLSRPKWLHVSILNPDGKGKEMVLLSRSSLLSTLPAEVCLDIIMELDYRDVQTLKASCRYFRYFIDSSVTEASRMRQLEEFEELERQSHSMQPLDAPCYTCLQKKPLAHFYNPAGTYYYTAQPPLPLPDAGTRYCIPCGFKTKRYAPGLQISVDNVTYLRCAGCKRLEKSAALPIGSARHYNGQSCQHCSNDLKILNNGWIFRFIQFLLGIIIFALACTGSTVPLTSVVTRESLRFIFTTTLVSFSDYGGMDSSQVLTHCRRCSPLEVH
jgi:hypothetical protein